MARCDCLNVVCILKGSERYVFAYVRSQRIEMMRLAGRFAVDPQLSFTWYDAAVLGKKSLELEAQCRAGGRRS